MRIKLIFKAFPGQWWWLQTNVWTARNTNLPLPPSSPAWMESVTSKVMEDLVRSRKVTHISIFSNGGRVGRRGGAVEEGDKGAKWLVPARKKRWRVINWEEKESCWRTNQSNVRNNRKSIDKYRDGKRRNESEPCLVGEVLTRTRWGFCWLGRNVVIPQTHTACDHECKRKTNKCKARTANEMFQ